MSMDLDNEKTDPVAAAIGLVLVGASVISIFKSFGKPVKHKGNVVHVNFRAKIRPK